MSGNCTVLCFARRRRAAVGLAPFCLAGHRSRALRPSGVGWAGHQWLSVSTSPSQWPSGGARKGEAVRIRRVGRSHSGCGSSSSSSGGPPHSAPAPALEPPRQHIGRHTHASLAGTGLQVNWAGGWTDGASRGAARGVCGAHVRRSVSVGSRPVARGRWRCFLNDLT